MRVLLDVSVRAFSVLFEFDLNEKTSQTGITSMLKRFIVKTQHILFGNLYILDNLFEMVNVFSDKLLTRKSFCDILLL